ncbi:MAG: hypothetical protein U0175_14050 [Caldilineaceae bacterium]
MKTNLLLTTLGASLALVLTLLFVFHSPMPAQAQNLSFDCTQVSQIPVSECIGLKAFFSATGGTHWFTKTGWLVTNVPCEWYGIECDPEHHHVQKIKLNENNLTGSSLAGLDLLPELTQLFLTNSKLTAISEHLRVATKLTDLDLHSNIITGEIPSWLSELQSMKSLLLYGNQLNGSIPQQICQLTNLQELSLQLNLLTGSVPPCLGQLTHLTSLWLGNNARLIGCSQFGLEELTQLMFLDLSACDLAGPIPPWLTQTMTNLHLLNLAANYLSGAIPSDIDQLSQLTTLRLEKNRLSGEIPLGLTKLSGLGANQNFSLSNNMLTATNPSVLSFLATRHPQWAETQTLAPANVLVANHTAYTATLLWNPLQSTISTGEYQIGLATQPGGPYSVYAQTNDKLSTSQTITNLCPSTTYYMAVRTHTPPNPGNRQYNDLYSDYSQEVAITTSPRQYNKLSLYALALDSDLNRQYDSLIGAIKASTALNTDELAVVLVDQADVNDTRLMSVQCGRIDNFVGLPDPKSFELDAAWREYNMANKDQLGAFLKWARNNFGKASKPMTSFTYVGHGIPIAPAIDDITKYITLPLTVTAANGIVGPSFPPLPGLQDVDPGTLTDNHPYSLISPYALAEALRIGTENGSDPIAVLNVVHCFGGTLEELYELANPPGNPFAEVMIGSPNYTYSGGEILGLSLKSVQSAQSAKQMALQMIQAYDRILNEADVSNSLLGEEKSVHPRILVAVDSQEVITLARTVDDVAIALLDSFTQSPSETKAKILQAHQKSQHYDTTTCNLPERPQDFDLNAEDGLSDLASFMLNLQIEFANSPVALKALTVNTELNHTVLTTTMTSGVPWFATEPKHEWAFDSASKGIALFTDFQGFKLPNDSASYIGWQAFWYNRQTSVHNPYPYRFVADSSSNWSDVLLRFWQDQLDAETVQTAACSTKLPEVHMVRSLFLPMIRR